jgi:pyrroline-5-carboxylate reductase
MATALASGLAQAGLTESARILASDVLPAAREHFTSATKARAIADNLETVRGSDVLVLAVKPQYVRPVLSEIRPALEGRHLLISIAAGVTLETMLGLVGREARLVRVMPNTPCLVGASASAYCLGGAATREDGQLVERMLSAVGVAVPLPEHLIDAVTGLSGSGPAYAYVMIEALSDGGVRMGLPRDVATKLAAQTLLGAARMVLETGEHPGALKDAVASPGGTTIAGLHALETGGLRGCLMNAVQAATLRSKELSQG